MNKRLDEIAEFDEDRAIDNSPPCPANYDSPWSKEFVDGARWQFDQNKAQLEAMRAERTMWKEKYIRDPDKGEEQFLKEENANLRAALVHAQCAIKDLGASVNEMYPSDLDGWADVLLAEIEKLERGGV